MTISPAALATGTARDVQGGVNPAVVAYLGISLGLALRLAQAEWLSMPPDLFYETLTAHGVGMVGIAGLAGAAIMWHFLRHHVSLNQGILVANLVLFLTGVVMILAAIYVGGFGGGWTFLYPLPATSGGVWAPTAAAVYLGGLLVIGVGFLLFYLDAGRAIIAEYGGLGAALGWPVLLDRSRARLPEPTIVASAMVTIVNTLGW
jgi:cytochrome c oxidase subunit 1